MSGKKIHSDQRIIDGLVKNNAFVIKSIYDDHAPKVINYIKKNSGDEMRAKDVIQDVLITIYNQATQKGLQLTCPFDAYFFLLCKRKWFNELKKKSLSEVTINEEIVSKGEPAEHEFMETSVFDDKQKLFQDKFKELGKACQDLLKQCFTDTNMQSVADKLDVSYAYARKKKSLCIGQLTKLVRSSAAYNQIMTT